MAGESWQILTHKFKIFYRYEEKSNRLNAIFIQSEVLGENIPKISDVMRELFCEATGNYEEAEVRARTKSIWSDIAAWLAY